METQPEDNSPPPQKELKPMDLSKIFDVKNLLQTVYQNRMEETKNGDGKLSQGSMKNIGNVKLCNLLNKVLQKNFLDKLDQQQIEEDLK